jgi:hypothetical protein
MQGQGIPPVLAQQMGKTIKDTLCRDRSPFPTSATLGYVYQRVGM